MTLFGLLVHKVAAGRFAVDAACHAARALCDVLQLWTENESNWPKRPITIEQCSALSHICYTKRNIQRKTRKQAQIEWSEGCVTKDDAHVLLSLNARVWSKSLDVLQPTVHGITSQFAEHTQLQKQFGVKCRIYFWYHKNLLVVAEVDLQP